MEVQLHGRSREFESRLARFCACASRCTTETRAKPRRLRFIFSHSQLTMPIMVAVRVSCRLLLACLWLDASLADHGQRNNGLSFSVATGLAATTESGFHELTSDRIIHDDESTFDRFNSHCRDVLCSGSGSTRQTSLDPFVKPFHRTCCVGGPSSLVLRWHTPCAGNLSTIVSPTQSNQDCGLDVPSPETYRLIDCSCYRRLVHGDLLGSLDEQCRFLADHSLSSPSLHDSTIDGHDVCLVSVTFDKETSEPVVNFSQPLPSIIGLQHSSPSRTTRTYVDTSCSSRLLEEVETGKLTNSCPHQGFIRVQKNGHSSSHAFQNEVVWLEAVDGTSSGMWPDRKSVV